MENPLKNVSFATLERATQILKIINEARELYYRLILVVGMVGSGKTSVLQELSSLTSAPIINVNLELSRRLLDLTERQRILQLPRILGKILDKSIKDLPVESIASQESLVLLDNIEMLFDVNLKQDPLRLLKSLSRKNTIVASWPGKLEKNTLSYADSEHREYKLYSYEESKDIIMIDVRGEKNEKY